MKVSYEIKEVLLRKGWFVEPGAYVLVDGQYGSTGKGLLASVLAEACDGRIGVVTTNAGPNSGHTAYSPVYGTRIMTQQIPVAAVVARQLGRPVPAFLNAGAIIDQDILSDEISRYDMEHFTCVHANAAVIEQVDRDAETDPLSGPARIAGTAKGTGSALARKIMREGNIAANRLTDSRIQIVHTALDYFLNGGTVFVETAQGFSLGVNSQFYPHTTSRECTVGQALADARIPHNKVQKVVACFRTFPIRVGNTPVGYSGDIYPDQAETSWEAIGQEPELTTVTKRVRRVFTWSQMQFRECLLVNQPDFLFINFAQYLKGQDLENLMHLIHLDYTRIMGKKPELVMTGHGPLNSDVRIWL